ncbi:xylose isomerase [Lederbergia ruris]|uniref:Xylose isomerase n=2 Tax=Lederbergia ruris TaxID=217495 RepID=A0ABQ4KFS4_9BACI|nr:xylose isomerase [Lederbergia ruris]
MTPFLEWREAMFKVGLCSITFRQLSVAEVIDISKKAGISGIEWGGDIHVPPGNVEGATQVAYLTKQANLQVSSYGSYYRVGYEEDGQESFAKVLETAIALTAPSIRVWAGRVGSREASEQDRKKVVDDAKRIAELAKNKMISIHFEYHRGTLTDTAESATQLMEEINHPNVFLYWQPAVNESVQKRIDSIERVSPWLSHVHVFYWENTNRLPFSSGVTMWEQYLNALKRVKGERYLLMEFVRENKVEQFMDDVEVLKRMVTNLNRQFLKKEY